MGVGELLGDAADAAGGLLGADDLGTRAKDGLSELDSMLTGDESRGDLRARQAAYAAAQQAGDLDRAGIRSEQSGLQGQVRDGFDPTAISDIENFEAMDHAAMRAAADTMDEGAIRFSASTWRTIAGQVEDHFAELRQTLGSAIANGWEGEAAATASAASTSYADHGASLGPAFALTASKMEEAASGAGETNATVPPVVAFNPRHAIISGILKAAVGMGSPADDAQQQRAAADAARQQAVRVMTSVYAPVYQQADAGVPTYAAPASVTNTMSDPTTSDPRGDVGTTTARSSGSDGSSAARSVDPGSGTGPGGWQTGSAAGVGPYWTDPAAVVSQGPDASGSGTPAPAAVSSAGFSPVGHGGGGFGPSGTTGGYGSAGAAGGPGPVGGGGLGAGVLPGGGRRSGRFGSGEGWARGNGAGRYVGGGRGVGGGSGGALGPGAARGLASGVGTAGPGGSTTSTGGVSGTAVGGRGAVSGMGGMAGGRGARGEDDGEHTTPSYLITEDHGSEIVGKVPAVAPPVIGA